MVHISKSEESNPNDEEYVIKSELEDIYSGDVETNEKSEAEEEYPSNMQKLIGQRRKRSRANYQREYRKLQKNKTKKAQESQSVNLKRPCQTGYKRTTDKQYSLLTHEMVIFQVENRSGKSADAIKFWNSLAEKLNALGPPYRTVKQWKKVWIDFRSFHSKRNFKSVPKFTRAIKADSRIDCDTFGVEGQEKEDYTFHSDNIHSTSPNVARSELEEYDYNFQPMQSNSNDYTPAHDSYTNASPDSEEIAPGIFRNLSSVPNHRSLPPLQPSNSRFVNQKLYALQNQLENQTKLLEHLSQISNTMTNLMERQVIAIEQQTEAVRRQACATEHHTLVMNSFIDKLREKMPKKNFKKSNSSSS